MKLIAVRTKSVTTFAKVSDADFEFISRWRWSLNSRGYAKRNLTIRSGGKRTSRVVYMHRVIAERAGLGVAGEVDHANGDKVDNQRTNLRTASRPQNCFNTGQKKSNTTGFKGVCFDKSRGMFVAHIRHGGSRHFLGRFNTAEAAHAAYCAAAERHHGEFANTK